MAAAAAAAAATYAAVRVARAGGPEVLELAALPRLVPTGAQVLVRVAAVGVNPVETYVRAGIQGYAPTYPYTPGHDCAGVVEAVGPTVTDAIKLGAWGLGYYHRPLRLLLFLFYHRPRTQHTQATACTPPRL